MEFYLPGTLVRGTKDSYTIIRNLVQGAFAFSYEATNSSGDACFLKCYYDPLPDPARFPWFGKYRSLQQEIQKRLTRISQHAIQTLDEFIQNGNYHQVLEWAQGRSLEDLYAAELQKDSRNEKSLLLAKVMMYALAQVHEQGIIHCDQKLANFFAQENQAISARYKIKAADFDLSLLADRPGPKSDDIALAGTFGYRSPEHIRRERPQFGSDIFTVGGIMLFELFTGVHPFEGLISEATNDDEAEAAILRAVEKGKIPLMSELVPARASTIPRVVQDLIQASFAAKAQDRPSAKEIHQALLGREMARRLVLIGGPAKLKWRIAEPTVFSRKMATALFQADAQTVSSNQAQFEPNENKTEWFVIPSPTATNKTMLDGKEISSRTPLKPGMKLQVGNPASGRIGFEMEVGFEIL